MQEDSIAKALADGSPISCATCPLYHQGNGYCGKSECGGPGAGKDFPDYAGPIPRERFVDCCLVCGSNKPCYLIIGLPTKFALCKKHRKVYDYVGHASPDQLKYPIRIIALPDAK